MTKLEQLEKIIKEQMTLVKQSYFFKVYLPFAWNEAREFCERENIDGTIFVDVAVRYLSECYRDLLHQQATIKATERRIEFIEANEITRDSNQEHVDVSMDLITRFETQKLGTLLCLRGLEPAFNESLLDDEQVYYSLNYME